MEYKREADRKAFIAYEKDIMDRLLEHGGYVGVE